MSRRNITTLVLTVVAMGAIIIVAAQPDAPTETIMTLAEGKEIATTMNHNVWPDGTIIHKRLGNGWVCVEIDGHHLLVLNRGRSSFGVAIDSCLKGVVEGAHLLQ